jgi:hypothetical protein
MEVVSFTPRPLNPQGKRPWYPLYRKLGGPQGRAVRGGEEKNSQPLPRLEPPIIQTVAQSCTTELSRLLYLSNKFFQKIKYDDNDDDDDDDDDDDMR